MGVIEHQEVYFHEYCETCKHFSKKQHEDPCDECLGSPTNANSHKPINWESNNQ